MFIECNRHKSKIQRNILYCIERCPKRCGQFYTVDPARIATLLREHPNRGAGFQLELFALAEDRPRRR